MKLEELFAKCPKKYFSNFREKVLEKFMQSYSLENH
tara:strand:+ start:2243 stop:2350 length:108 start_codon:yes stop_codon:yes gene_type:complete